MRTLLPVLALILACEAPPKALPSVEAAQAADAQMARADAPPLVQTLYDYAFLPEVQRAEQRVRLLIWLRHMGLGEYQLRALGELHARAEAERGAIEAAQAEVVARYEPELAAVYDRVWQKLSAGVPLDDPSLTEESRALWEARRQHERSAELLALRLRGVQAVLEAERPWLATLSPQQEALLADCLFLLRHRLDPYANPGDFSALIGTVFSSGEYGTLTRGSFSAESDQLDLARLWSDLKREDIQGPVFNNARRELLLYMVLLEPALPEAIAAALAAPGPTAPGPAAPGPAAPGPAEGSTPPPKPE